ncbi:CtsR family transcriptional regulator [Alkaliphilus transvaalensis]|uniref:CtsR family transcriptional regulator n=1 Tax=Alkaliphilus transvaalensis TaxID=114628 RepID=UPI00047CD0B5|nr:CtsR family transcriptional regulator [Alkaliphilus transvaalensis]
MTTMSSIIEAFIKDLIKKSDDNLIEIQRNELAKHFNCAPSQINYVLMTRFSLSQGYIIESQRGGGGYIKIKQMIMNRNRALYHMIFDEIGNSITAQQGQRIITYLVDGNKITEREAKIIKVAIDASAINASAEYRNQLRAKILKNMLSIVLGEG